MASIHADGAVDMDQVLQGIVKEHQVHLGVGFIILLKDFLN
jgi:hypothetical protein